MRINYCQKRTDMILILYFSTWLNQKSMPHDLLKAKEMYLSEKKQISFQWLEMKNVGLA